MLKRLLVTKLFALWLILAFETNNVVGIHHGSVSGGRLHLPLAFLCCFCHVGHSSPQHSNQDEEETLSLDGEDLQVILVKIGGSSLTYKAQLETLNDEALQWFSKTIQSTIDDAFLAPSPYSHSCPEAESGYCSKSDRAISKKKRAYIIVHGAGSFGHHTAKEFSLKGQISPPPPDKPPAEDTRATTHRRWTMEGLAKTRLSVQSLNQMLVSSLVAHGVNAVAISPCFAVPNMQAHGGDQATSNGLATVIRDTLQAGLVPVLHGDACRYGRQNAGILSGDILVEKLGLQNFIAHVVFFTDVDGVYTLDPRVDPTATLLRYIRVDKDTLDIAIEGHELNVTGSSHDHDVTGGLKTKLASAAVIAASGKNVTIVKCGAPDAERILSGEGEIEKATTVYSTSS